MKKLFFTAALSLLVMGVFAQKKVMKSAEKAFKKGSYEEAETLAKQASENAETSGNSSVYSLLGKISLQRFIDGGLEDLDQARESLNRFNKALEIAEPKAKEDILEPALTNPLDETQAVGGQQIGLLEYWLVSVANKALGEEDYAKAYPYLDLAYQITPSVDRAFFTGYSADNVDNVEKAAEYFKIVIAAEEAYSNKSYAYQKLIQNSIDGEKYDDALEVIRSAQDSFPDEKLYGNWEVEVLIKAEKMGEAITNLKKIVADGGADKVTYYTLGFLQWNNEELADAEVSAMKALELDPEYLDAFYVGGSVIFNQGVEIMKEASMSVDDDATYDAKKKEAHDKFNKALPMFEKLLAADPNDVYALRPLSTIYDQLGMDEKRDATLDKLEKLEEGGN
ncbi:lipopolysaccharide assembly protein LapB [Roseivirga sp. E12]|uniref:tetratricopeptide repeat protein n=1 Tax=Roseivirga sp. E12 TaxID=2819237 RepID=UPI001ABCA477|nr:hypothetical protein [Roseivirga sp. E12]MBO3697308.1 hypothetical protein [Roseivirga sp. E12]